MDANIAPRMVATVGFARFVERFIQIVNMLRRPRSPEHLFTKYLIAASKVEGFCLEASGFGEQLRLGRSTRLEG
tara:strand:- start:264 stop:485 length:222 start_codon:yes stop_codon:yes gene_type:complete